MTLARFAPLLLAASLLTACQGSDLPELDEENNGNPSGGSADQTPRPTYSPTTLNVSSPTLIQIRANDPDDVDGFTFRLTDKPDHGTVALDSTAGKAIYTPNAGYSGPDTFEVSVTDTAGNQGKITVQLSVQALSACTELDPSYTPMNPRLTGTQPFNFAITPSTNPECEGFSYTLARAPIAGSVKIGASGSVVYTPSGATGRDSFIVSITATGGAASSVTLNVNNGMNQAPSLSVSTPKWDTARKSLESNATITDGDMNDSHTLAIAMQPMQGKASVDSATRKIIYTPNMGAAGVDSLMVRVTDLAGAYNTATLTYELGGQANAAPKPTATPNPASVGAGKTINITIAANDDNVGDMLSYTVSKIPGKGSVIFDTTKPNVAIYTSNGLSGADSFEVTVFDQVGASGKVTVNVNISAGNSAPKPTAAPNVFTTSGGAVSIDVLPNDPDNAANVAGGHTYQVSQQPTKGTVKISAMSTKAVVTYTPTAGATGGDSFAILVTDTGGLSGTVIVNGTLSASTTGNAANGEVLFNDNCSACHSITSSKIKPYATKSTADLLKAFDKNAAMQKFKTLSTQQLADLIAYIKSANGG
jgi:hypothetical protein